MGVIITRSPRTRQPQGATPVNYGNAITNGLILAASPGITPFDAVTGAKLVPFAPTSPTPTRFGIALDQSAGTNEAYFPATLPASNTAYTLVTIAANISESRGAYALVLGDCSSNTFSQIRLGLNNDSSGAASAGNFALVDYGNSAPYYKAQVATTAATYVDGKPHIYGAVRNGANADLWFDGSKVASTSSASGSCLPAQRIYVSGDLYSHGDSVNQQVLALVWLRALNDAEMASVMANPWQVFATLPRRIWVPSSVSGGSNVALTGSAVTASAGTLTPSVSIPLSGQAATASAGTISPTSSVPVSGQAATASAGTLTPAVSASLSGQAATVSAGTVSPAVTIALTGTAVTASAGTVTYSAGNNISLSLTGAEVTASAGSLGLSSTVPVSGSAASASAGTLNPGTSVAVSGTAVTASAGTLTYSANQDLTLALSGEAVQVSAGTITVIGGVSAVAVTSGAPGPRQQRYVVYINGKRYIGSLHEIEQLVAEFAEEQAEKAVTAKPPKKPRIKVEAGRAVGEKPSDKPAPKVEVQIQQQVRDIYAEAYARAIAQLELDEEEDIISLL